MACQYSLSSQCSGCTRLVLLLQRYQDCTCNKNCSLRVVIFHMRVHHFTLPLKNGLCLLKRMDA